MGLEQIYRRSYDYLYIMRKRAHGSDTKRQSYFLLYCGCLKSMSQAASTLVIWNNRVLNWEISTDFPET